MNQFQAKKNELESVFPNPRVLFCLQPQKDAVETEIQSPFLTYRKMGHCSPQEWGNPQLVPTAAPSTEFVPFSSLHIHPGGWEDQHEGWGIFLLFQLSFTTPENSISLLPQPCSNVAFTSMNPTQKSLGSTVKPGGKKKKEKGYLESDYEFFSHPLLDTSSWNNVGREREPHPLSSTCKLREQMWSLVLPCKVVMGIFSFISFLMDAKNLEGI